MKQLSERTLAIQHLLASIFASQRALRVLAPEFKWAGLGNLLGDFGELIAIEAYSLTKAPAGSEGFDAIMADGRTVQIKANFAATQIGFRGTADMLLVLNVKPDGSWDEMYFGSFARVAALSRRSERDNKSMVAVSKLRALHEREREYSREPLDEIAHLDVLPIEGPAQ